VITIGNQIDSLGYELVYETRLKNLSEAEKEDLIEKLYKIKIVESEIEIDRQVQRQHEIEYKKKTGKK